jgi:hypothetical protein
MGGLLTSRRSRSVAALERSEIRGQHFGSARPIADYAIVR